MSLTPRFLLSATNAEHFPASGITGDAREVAFLGRSNVGKSSLLNALVGSQQAHTSSTPGRTRAINFYGLYLRATARPELILADLPGYGYAKISRSISAEWPSFIEPYLEQRNSLALCLCLVDSNVPPQLRDTQLVSYLRSIGRPHILLATKSDRLSHSALQKAIAALQREHGVDEVIAVSAKTKAGLKSLWSRLQLLRGGEIA